MRLLKLDEVVGAGHGSGVITRNGGMCLGQHEEGLWRA